MTKKEKIYREHIESYFPNITIKSFDTSFDQGLHNDLIFLNKELVIRFGKEDFSKDLLDNEYKIIRLVKDKTEIPVPDMTKLEHGVVYYPYISGIPLFRHKLLHMDEHQQNVLMEKLGFYMYQLHSIPNKDIQEQGISVSLASSEDYRDMYKRLTDQYERIKKDLYPHMRIYNQACVDAAFKGIENGESWFKYQPCLIHGDLGPEHIILNENYDDIAGILDFGASGTGSAAFDIGILLDTLGELLVSKMFVTYPNLDAILQRSRVGLCSAFWHLRGLDTGDMFWHLVHMMTAKDIKY